MDARIRNGQPGTRAWLIAGQATLGALVLLLCAAAPPRSGDMLVVPLFPGSAAETTNWLVARDARIMHIAANGRDIIVNGQRDRLTWGALEHGALLIRVPGRLCGYQPSSE